MTIDQSTGYLYVGGSHSSFRAIDLSITHPQNKTVVIHQGNSGYCNLNGNFYYKNIIITSLSL